MHETVISFIYTYIESKEKSSNILFVTHCLKHLQDSSHSTAF